MKFSTCLICLIILTSCGNNTSKTEENTHELKEIKPFFKEEPIFEDEINSIENNSQLIEVSSLDYLRNDGKTFLVKGWVDENGGLKKLSFRSYNDKGEESIFYYYYIGKRKIATICDQTILKGNESMKVLTKSFYDDSSNVFFSKKALITEQSEDNYVYKKCKPVNHNDNLAWKIINQENEFETRFQGFTQNMGRNFLIVGTDNYTSTIAFGEYSDILNKLKLNEANCIGKKLIVDFTLQTEANGFTFQALKNLRFAP